MGKAELCVNQSRQTAWTRGHCAQRMQGEKICKMGLDNSGNIEGILKEIFSSVHSASTWLNPQSRTIVRASAPRLDRILEFCPLTIPVEPVYPILELAT